MLPTTLLMFLPKRAQVADVENHDTERTVLAREFTKAGTRSWDGGDPSGAGIPSRRKTPIELHQNLLYPFIAAP
jgi:hypothetical protein